MSGVYFGGGGNNAVEFRRTDQDRKPPSRVLTGLLMGDPQPDREARAEALRLKAKPPRELPPAPSRGRS